MVSFLDLVNQEIGSETANLLVECEAKKDLWNIVKIRDQSKKSLEKMSHTVALIQMYN